MSEWPVREFDAVGDDVMPALADGSDGESDGEEDSVAAPLAGPGVSRFHPRA